MNSSTYHGSLKEKIDCYIHSVYKLSKNFPKEELYGITSQLRRSALSVMLNYVEGYARMRAKVHKNFIEIAYGSLQESKYLLNFSFVEKFMTEKEHNEIIALADTIGAMLYGIIKKL